MVGITSFAAYAPAYRLSRDGISRLWGTRSLGGERAVAKYDEDTLTMAVEETRGCLKRSRLQAEGVFFASTTSPYQEKQAATLMAAAACNVALAVGVEKLKDTGWTGVQPANVVGRTAMGTAGTELELSPPGIFALLASGYFHRHGLDPEYGKRLLAEIAVENHHNGSLNPKAHFQHEITVEQVLKAPIVAAPLGVLDCCGVSDGAAAAIVTRADMARNFRADPIYIKSMAISAGPGRDRLYLYYRKRIEQEID